MRRLIALLLCLVAAPAWGMSSSSVPPKFPIPWAFSAASAYIRSIPTNSQIGIQNCAASLTDGFPPLTFTPSAQGGCPPFGQDFNGILNQVTLWGQWQATGSPVPWDSAFSTAIGGYPKGAVVAAAQFGSYWLSLVDNNTSDPDTGGANWQPLGAGVPTGATFPFTGVNPPAGYLLANGQAVSRTTYANLFAVMGTAYGTGDGSTTFNMPDLRGRAPFGSDTMSASAANRLTSASGCAGATLGAGCGNQTYTLTIPNLPPWTLSFAGTTQTWNTNQNNVWSGESLLASPGGASPVFAGLTALSVTITPAGNITGTGVSGGTSNPVPTVPPAQVFTYIVKY